MTARTDQADPSEPRAPEPERPETDAVAAARRRAAAFLDLWERQLAHAAAHGPLPARPRRPGGGG